MFSVLLLTCVLSAPCDGGYCIEVPAVAAVVSADGHHSAIVERHGIGLGKGRLRDFLQRILPNRERERQPLARLRLRR